MKRFIKGTGAQRSRLIALLKLGSVSTIQAREEHGILAPAARICELRKSGHNIRTTYVSEHAEDGDSHRVALYTLKPGGFTQFQLWTE